MCDLQTLMAQKGKQTQNASVAHKAPQPEEENPRVRCWKCGAFGHKANSLRCPMKHWSGVVALHAQGSNEMKESQNSWNLRDLWNQGPFNKAARLTQQRVQNKDQRQALHQRLRQKAPGGPQHNWKNKTESCDYKRVRCWNCWSFGHKASSHRCPLKHWNRALAHQAMGSDKMKENLKPWNPQVHQNQGHFNRAAKATLTGLLRHEEQRQAPSWRLPWRPRSRPQQNWKDETEPCGSVMDAHTPRPDHNTKREYVGDPDLTTWSPKRKRVMKSTAPPVKGVESSACLPPGSKNGQEGPVTDSAHTGGIHFVQDPTHSVHERDNRPHSALSIQGLDQTLIHHSQAKFLDGNSHSIQPAAACSVGQDSDLVIKVPGKRAAQTSSQISQNPQKKARLSPCLKGTQSPDLQPPQEGPPIKTLQPCHMPQFPPVPGVPVQPLRKEFTPLEKGQWSSMPMTPPSHPPAEKLTAPAQIPATTEKSEALCFCVPLSVLLEALHLSSFSEVGDGQ